MFDTNNLRRFTESAAEDDGLTASIAGHPAVHDLTGLQPIASAHPGQALLMV